jgi:hypothetical protein
MKPLLFAAVASLLAFAAFAQEVSQFERLRASYTAAVNRAVKPVTESYLKELTALRDTYMRSSRLKEAVQVDEEIKLVSQKLAAMSPVPALAAAPSPGGGKAVMREDKATIPANDPDGYKLGDLRQGDIITLQYVDGVWKDHGGIATENPDTQTAKDPASALVIARGSAKGKPGDVLTVVPGGTANKPFSYTVQTTRSDLVLRINKNSENPKNPGKVSYHVKVTR